MRYVLLFLLSFFVGIFISKQNYEMKNLWDADRNGLSDLNNQLAKDKTERLAMIVFTEQRMYGIQSLETYDAGGHKGYRLLGGIMDADGKIVAGNIQAAVNGH